MKVRMTISLVLLCLLLGPPHSLSAMIEEESSGQWPKRVLLTNDNGINDKKLVALAHAFAQVSETYVVAPLGDRSGSTNYAAALTSGKLEVETRDLGGGIRAFGVDGYPADCVLLALAGIMAENPPDLVVSGINGGPNLAADWIGSGTIGAARFASFTGIPAIAVSGLDDDMEGAVGAAADWVVRFSQSRIVRRLESQRYLTVSIPRVAPSSIKGIKIAARAGLLEVPVFNRVSRSETREVWRITSTRRADYEPPAESDVAQYNSGYIVIVPMQADELDYEALSRLSKLVGELPKWNPSIE